MSVWAWLSARSAPLFGAALVLVAACTSSLPDTAGETPSPGPAGEDLEGDTSGKGEQPDATAEAIVEMKVDRILSGDESFPDGFLVPAGEIWEFASDTSTTVESGGNVIVQGVLRMRPADYDVSHVLRFIGVDESGFVGGGMEILPSDTGLWVTGEGQLDIVGSQRAGWNRTGTDPTWQPGDEVRVAPTAVGDSTTFAEFQPGNPVPTVSYAGRTYATEVLNLTRNVRIEGTGDGEASPTSNGRAHIWINSMRPQTIKYAELRHMGPRRAGSENPTEGVLGRYPLHFHMSEDGVRGSIVEGVVVHDSGNRAFVAHKSHGVTFRDTIAFNVFDDPYWWDRGDDDSTNDLTYDHAMAAYVRFDPVYRGYRLSGFFLGLGENLTVIDSVAVGVQGNKNASGFHWPESANQHDNNIWNFQGNVGHNNRTSGIFVWQNDNNDHIIEDFVAYRNGAFGVDHGAYRNRHRYDGLVSFENGAAGIQLKAAGSSQRWSNVDTDGIVISDHRLPSDDPVVFEQLTLRGQVIVEEEGEPVRYEFRNSQTADGEDLSPEDFDVRRKLSTIIVVLGDGSSFEL